MTPITDVAELERIYGAPSGASMAKVADRLTPAYRRWIAASRFCILTTVGPDGTDGSPRGDDGPVVKIADAKTLLLPDWRGNNRIDSLRNIVGDGRVSLMFMVPGSSNVIRVNGTAVVSADAELTERFERQGQHPRTVVAVTVREVYFQCARAIMRSRLWTSGDESLALPSAGDMLADVSAGATGGARYDADWTEWAEKTMW